MEGGELGRRPIIVRATVLATFPPYTGSPLAATREDEFGRPASRSPTKKTFDLVEAIGSKTGWSRQQIGFEVDAACDDSSLFLPSWDDLREVRLPPLWSIQGFALVATNKCDSLSARGLPLCARRYTTGRFSYERHTLRPLDSATPACHLSKMRRAANILLRSWTLTESHRYRVSRDQALPKPDLDEQKDFADGERTWTVPSERCVLQSLMKKPKHRNVVDWRHRLGQTASSLIRLLRSCW